jgi:hypothetical protein
MNHLDEMARTVTAAMQIAEFGCAINLFAAGGARNVAGARGQRPEDGIEVLDNLRLAADHHAVTALEAPDTAAGADIDVIKILAGEFMSPPDVVDVIGVAAIDEDVPCVQERYQSGNGLVHDPGGHHEPDRPRPFEPIDEIHHMFSAFGAFSGELVHCFL